MNYVMDIRNQVEKSQGQAAETRSRPVGLAALETIRSGTGSMPRWFSALTVPRQAKENWSIKG